MKQIRNWKVGPNPPDIYSGWIHKGVAKYFNNGKWEVIGGSPQQEEELSPSNMIEVTITDTQLASLLNGKNIVVTDPNVNSLYDGIVLKVSNYSYFLRKVLGSNESARFQTDDVVVHENSSELTAIVGVVSRGVLTLSSTHIGFGPESLMLEIGDNDDIKKYNLSVLKSGFFLAQLDYGYGVGTWQPTSGGFVHVTTAYGQDVFYKINVDGSIIKEDDYIKPNHPYTIVIEADQIGTPVDLITAAGLLKCGELIINGSTGPITYTRSVDSTPNAVYFTSSKKDDTLQVLTYMVSTRTITASVAKPHEKVKKVEKLQDATLPLVIDTINTLIQNLQDAGIMES